MSEARLLAAMTAADNAPANMVLQVTLVEVTRINETKGFTDSEMEYWADRLEQAVESANEVL